MVLSSSYLSTIFMFWFSFGRIKVDLVCWWNDTCACDRTEDRTDASDIIEANCIFIYSDCLFGASYWFMMQEEKLWFRYWRWPKTQISVNFSCLIKIMCIFVVAFASLFILSDLWRWLQQSHVNIFPHHTRHEESKKRMSDTIIEQIHETTNETGSGCHLNA